MANVTLNEDQKRLVTLLRQALEVVAGFRGYVDLVRKEIANQQTTIVNNDEALPVQPDDTLGDGTDGQPRIDAPVLTYRRIADIDTFLADMQLQISDAELNIIISLLARNYPDVVRRFPQVG